MLKKYILGLNNMFKTKYPGFILPVIIQIIAVIVISLVKYFSKKKFFFLINHKTMFIFRPFIQVMFRYDLFTGGLSTSCNQIPPANRTDCGWGGISESQCYKLNCCFDSTIPSTKFCFCPTSECIYCLS